MKLVKSLVLGSAAAFVGVTGAQAADLPLAEPVEYVKVCDTYGAGFFYIPGSDTCLLIGGFVRQEISVAEQFDTGDADSFKDDGNLTGYRTRARLWFDARTETEYGTVRGYVRLQFQRESGGFGGSASTNPDATGDDQLFDKAFIQFAGITAGVADSFWDFKPYPTFYNPFVSDRTPAVLAYTASFGGGFSASVALEDSTQRRRTTGGAIVDPYAEQELPDLVGNLRVKQGWGEAQLSGFLRENKADQAVAFNDDEEVAWGVMLGGQVNLPFLAKGDYVWASAAYAEGNLSYLGVQDANFGIGGTQRIYELNRRSDFNVVGGDVENTEGFALNVGLLHYWTPQWRSGFQASYIDVDYKQAGGALSQDWSAITAGANIIWTPVKKLDIGLELTYANVDHSNAVKDLARGPGRTIFGLQDDQFAGRLRIQRDF